MRMESHTFWRSILSLGPTVSLCRAQLSVQTTPPPLASIFPCVTLEYRSLPNREARLDKMQCVKYSIQCPERHRCFKKGSLGVGPV